MLKLSFKRFCFIMVIGCAFLYGCSSKNEIKSQDVPVDHKGETSNGSLDNTHTNLESEISQTQDSQSEGSGSMITNTIKKYEIIENENGTFLYFGDYPQQVLLEEDITSELRTASYDSNNMATIDGVTYSYIKCKETTDIYKKGEIVYFRHEPILWRVLYQEDDKLLLMSEYILDAMPYHATDESVTWETCTLRSWLNGYEGSANLANISYTNSGDSFMSKAFSSSEQDMLLKTQLENSDFSSEQIYSATEDTIFLLSKQDVINTDYGFENTLGVTKTREAYVTEYAGLRGGSISTENGAFVERTLGTGPWWIRTGGMNGFTACNMDPAIVFINSVTSEGQGIRPAIYIRSFVLDELH